jgi:hypothetical protein
LLLAILKRYTVELEQIWIVPSGYSSALEQFFRFQFSGTEKPWLDSRGLR